MDSRTLLRQLLRTPSTCRTISTPQSTHFAIPAPHLPHARYLSLPRVIQPSFWASMIPSFGRTRPTSGPSPNEWNPATPYIILSLLVGSQAIQVLWLKRDRMHDMRRAEAKMGILREVIERVKAGEDVDVEKVLGTGIESEEKEWAEVMREIADEELLFQSRRRRKAEREAAKENEAKQNVQEVEHEAETEKNGVQQDGTVKVETYKGAKFY